MFNRVLFLLSFGLSLALLALVLLTPWLADLSARSAVLSLFAHDVTIRRAALACALGLAVTAVLFFRAAHQRSATAQKDGKSAKRPRFRNTVGA